MKKNRQEPILKSFPVALVTGATSTLGGAIGRKLAKQGYRLLLHYGKSREKIIALQKELLYLGVESHSIRADLSNPKQVRSVFGRAMDRWGRLDLLVNNAALFKPTPLWDNQWEDWIQLLKINAFSPCALAAAAKPWLQKTQGSIVNITDIYGELPILKDYAAYSVSKAALLFLTKYLASEFAPDIRVNAVSPGVISFPEKYDGQKRRKLVQRTALKRQGTPEEIAEAVWFLASNRFVTGQVLRVDGGRFIS